MLQSGYSDVTTVVQGFCYATAVWRQYRNGLHRFLVELLSGYESGLILKWTFLKFLLCFLIISDYHTTKDTQWRLTGDSVGCKVWISLPLSACVSSDCSLDDVWPEPGCHSTSFNMNRILFLRLNTFSLENWIFVACSSRLKAWKRTHGGQKNPSFHCTKFWGKPKGSHETLTCSKNHISWMFIFPSPGWKRT